MERTKEQDANFGRIVRQQEEATKERDLLISKASRISDSLYELSNLLRDTPECVTFDGESGPCHPPRLDFNSRELDMDAIKRVCGRIRELDEKISQLDSNKRNLASSSQPQD